MTKSMAAHAARGRRSCISFRRLAALAVVALLSLACIGLVVLSGHAGAGVAPQSQTANTPKPAVSSTATPVTRMTTEPVTHTTAAPPLTETTTAAAAAAADAGTTSAAPAAGRTTEPTMRNAPKEMDRWRAMRLPADWMECIRRNLRLDERGRPLHAVTEMADAIPLLITPLTGDVKFFPFFVCSMDVAVRYHYVIQNERDPETTAAIDELERRFGDSGRLLVVRNRYNLGYSGSMNQGFDWALRERTAEEVPWVFACGVDTIFEAGLLATMVGVVKNNTRGDAAMLAALRAEVEMEERLVREGNYSYYERWAPRGRPLKVLRSGYPGVPLNVRTAPLLPDRVRYMVADENREDGIVPPAELRTRFFGDYVATVTPVPSALGTIAVTRLALSTVGFFDENYFPAYMDDIDWRWRHFAYGFASLEGEPNGPIVRWHHYNAANLRGSPFVDEDLERYGTEDNHSRRAFLGYIHRSQGLYDKLKFGPRDRVGVWRQAVEKGEYRHMFFNVSRFPADTWVLDATVSECMFRHTYSYETKTWARPHACAYRPRTLEASGILGVDQLASYKTMIEQGKHPY